MPDPSRIRGSHVDHDKHCCRQTVAQAVIINREQGAQSQGRLDAGAVTENANRTTITLQNGAVVEARQAAAVLQDLDTLLTNAPDEFASLLALAQGRDADANPDHFKSLRAHAFLDWHDGRTIQPLVRDVLLNSFQQTSEGPVIAPLRLQDAADLPAAEQAQAELDRWTKRLWSRIQRRQDPGLEP